MSAPTASPATEHSATEHSATEHPTTEHSATKHPAGVSQHPAWKPEDPVRERGASAQERETRALENPAPVLQDLQWEQLANELEDWLDAGHRPPLPAGLEARPAGLPPVHLERRLTNLTTRLTAALREMATERSGLESSIRATAQAQRASAVTGGATPSYLDTGA